MLFFLLSIVYSLEGAFDYQIWRLDTAFERNFGPEGGGGGEWDGNLNERIFKSSNAREIAQEGDVETSNKSTHTTFKNSPKVKNVICLFAYN